MNLKAIEISKKYGRAAHRLVAVIALCFAFFSCDSSDDAALIDMTDPTVLQKVVFYPNSNSPVVYDFYQNGLIKSITRGSDIKTFTYDANDNLTTFTSTGLSPYTMTFTYDANDRLTSFNGTPITYSVEGLGGKYTITHEIPAGGDPYDYPSRTEYRVDDDFRLVSALAFYGPPGDEFSMPSVEIVYDEDNLKSIGYNGFDTERNYQFEDTANPLAEATLPAFRTLALFNPDIVADHSNISVNNAVRESYASEDPESFQFTYTFNAYGLPVLKIAQMYDFNSPTGASFQYAHYYYQGDVGP